MNLFIYEIACAGGIGPEWGASLKREGWAMLEAVAGDFARIPDVHVTTLVDEHTPTPPGHRCRRVAPAEEPRVFRECAAQAKATLVIAPEFDDFLGERSQWVLDAGGSLLGALPEGISYTGDKRVMHGHWRQFAVRTPDTTTATAAAPTAFGPPWVCKPCQGAGRKPFFWFAMRPSGRRCSRRHAPSGPTAT